MSVESTATTVRPAATSTAGSVVPIQATTACAGWMKTIGKNALRSVHAGHDTSNSAASDISCTSTSSPLKKPGWPQALASFTASVSSESVRTIRHARASGEPGEPVVGLAHQ